MDRPQRDRPLKRIFIERGYDDTLPLDAILARSQRGEWYFRRLDLTEHQLSGLNFRGADLSYCHAPRSNWASTYLAGVRFCGANLVGADLRGAYLRGADLRSLDLRSTDLRGADLSQTDLRGTDFRGADIAGICWHHSRGDRTTHLPTGLTFEALGIQPIHAHAQWTGLTLSRADLRYLDLSQANFTQALLIRADLRGSNISHASLEDAQLSGAIYDDRTQLPNKFAAKDRGMVCLGDRADLSSADLSTLDLSGMSLQGANLSRANLSRSHLIKTNLQNSNLTSANLSHSYALGCDLTNANLESAKLDGIDLRTGRLPSGKTYGAERSPFDAIALANALSIHDPNLRRR